MSRDKQNNNQSMELSLEEVEFFKNPKAKIHQEAKIEKSKKKVKSFNLSSFYEKWSHVIFPLAAILFALPYGLCVLNAHRNIHNSINKAISSEHADQVIAFVDKNNGSFFSGDLVKSAVDVAIENNNTNVLPQLIGKYKDTDYSVFLDRDRAKEILVLFSTDQQLPNLKNYWDTFGKSLQEDLDHDNIGKRNRELDHMLEVVLRAAEEKHQMKVLSYAVSQITDDDGIISSGFSRAINSNDMTLIKFYADHGTDFKNEYLVHDIASTLINRNDIQGIKFLVEHGADIHHDRDQELRTAQRLGHVEIADYIKSVPIQDVCPEGYKCVKKD